MPQINSKIDIKNLPQINSKISIITIILDAQSNLTELNNIISKIIPDLFQIDKATKIDIKNLPQINPKMYNSNLIDPYIPSLKLILPKQEIINTESSILAEIPKPSETSNIIKTIIPAEIQVNKINSQSVIIATYTYSSTRYIYSTFHSIMSIIAIYLSFKCNKGFDLGSFMLACCCPYIYIIYILATKGTCGILEKESI